MADNSGRFLEGLVVGGLIGFIFGILSAPKSGAELRKQLADNSEDLYKQASDQLGELSSLTGSKLHDLKDKSQHAIEDIKGKGGDVIKKASDSVQQTKDQVATKIQEMAGQSTQVLVDDVESATSGS
ncbi:MAG: YtxH domain-containing protein [Candidatus Obscuribacterales bacterium]|nr:YtxH domain-containing protein [Candidatus Obscuribacterales bacterium]